MYELGQKLSFFLTKAERDKGQQDFFRFLTFLRFFQLNIGFIGHGKGNILI